MYYIKRVLSRQAIYMAYLLLEGSVRFPDISDYPCFYSLIKEHFFPISPMICYLMMV